MVKSSQDFATWLATRDRDFRRRHLIPEDPELWKIERLDLFVAAREELIRARLSGLLENPAIPLPAGDLVAAT